MRRILCTALTAPALLVPFALMPSAAVAAEPTGGARSPAPRAVTARAETPPLFDDAAGGDADADDPAIWVHPQDPAASLVVATAKNAGLRVYDLAGHELQSIAAPAAPGPDDEAGRFNNVDLVTGFRLGSRTVDLAVVSDRGRDTLRFYRVDPVARRLVDVTAADVPYAFSADQAQVNEQRTAYGLASWSSGGRAYALASRRSTPDMGLFELVARGATVTYRRVDSLSLPAEFRLPDGSSWSPCADPGDGPQVEGTVVDVENGVAYLGQETVGLWRVPVAGGRFAGRPAMVERTREFGIPAAFDPEEDECVVDYAADPGYGGRIAADVEGLTIQRTGLRSGTLLASSQGDDTFYTYDRRSNRPLGRFAVTAGPAVDGSQQCDGAAVSSVPLPGFPGGLLVVQDGENTPEVADGDGEARVNSNFKFVDAGFLTRR